ncbi:hypothetical protein HDU97_005692 [Phlyctochytrium planicorne]|nr:hypothetical protein HDU97_005692 [Phlyctochytrium planicorne]
MRSLDRPSLEVIQAVVLASVCASLPTTNEALRALNTALIEAEILLETWRSRLPAARSFDNNGIWRTEAVNGTPPDFGRIAIYLCFHLAKCMIFRPVLRYAKDYGMNPCRVSQYCRAFTGAEASAKAILEVVNDLFKIDQGKWALAPIHAFSFFWSGLVFSDLARLTTDMDKRAEHMLKLESLVNMLTVMMDKWPIVGVWLDELGKSVEMIDGVTSMLDLESSMMQIGCIEIFVLRIEVDIITFSRTDQVFLILSPMSGKLLIVPEEGDPYDQFNVHPSKPKGKSGRSFDATESRYGNKRISCDDCRKCKRRCDGRRKRCALYIGKVFQPKEEWMPAKQRSQLSNLQLYLHNRHNNDVGFVRDSLDPLIMFLGDIKTSFSFLFENPYDEQPDVSDGCLFETEKIIRRNFLARRYNYTANAMLEECISLDKAPENLALRFASSAYAARFSHPQAPDKVVRSLYGKAMDIVIKNVDKPPSLQFLQATLLTFLCAGSVGSQECHWNLSGIIFRMVDYLSLLQATTVSRLEESPTQRDIWWKCTYAGFFFDSILSLSYKRPRFLEKKQDELPGTLNLWISRYPDQKPPFMLILAEAANIIYHIQTTASEIPESFTDLQSFHSKLISFRVQLDTWRESLPCESKIDADDMWRFESLEATTDFEVITVFMAYQMALCMIHRPIIIHARKHGLNPALLPLYSWTFKDAFMAACQIYLVVSHIRTLDRSFWAIDPFQATCFHMAGMVLLDFARLTGDVRKREECLEKIQDITDILRTVVDTWPVVRPCLDDLTQNIEELDKPQP